MVLKYFKFTFLLIILNSVISISQSNEIELSTQKKIIETDSYIKDAFGGYDELLQRESIPKDIQKKLYYKVKASIDIFDQDSSFLTNDKKAIELILDQSYAFQLDMDKYDFYKLMDRYDALKEEIDKKTFHLRFFTSLNFITWNYQLGATKSSGEKVSLFSEERGPCIGGGVVYFNSYWGSVLEGCYAYMSATVGEDSTSIQYNQTDVPVDAFLLRTGLYWRPKADLRIGVYPVFVYHRADYTPPPGGTVQDENELSYGAMVSGRWAFNDQVAMKISLGDLKSYKSSIWLFGFEYQF